ncbi:hypothetical protein [Chryseolinea lacunae]|uniref:DoxX family protein n=1 Tax=Chryseolinea lacunae TaxID=2801331 RepID=A0ABS1KLU4_9BACT|nr:hypothetical protein [Chryseolinea lacunae]MBL0740430.1 hypothetical protein [Chryseolinea lacunae]
MQITKLISPGRAIFAIGILGLGFLCVLTGDFIIGRPPAWSESLSAMKPALGYVSGAVVVLACAAILASKKGDAGALIIALLILLLSGLRFLPTVMTDWLGGYKTMALLGGALIVACSFGLEGRTDTLMFMQRKKTTDTLIAVGCFLLAAFFIAGGYAHFKYADFVIGFIPEYIPFHAFFTYFCGICLVAGGVGILIPATRMLAALLSSIMLLGWFLLLHIPRFVANPGDPSDRMGLCESFAFAGIFFVLAGISVRKK